MTAECLGETGMSLKTKLTIVMEKGQQEEQGETTHKEESHNWKMLQWVKDFVHLN